ncbi:hypothetical protein GCM10020295_51080 [Streptomyces cinereospinus]
MPGQGGPPPVERRGAGAGRHPGPGPAAPSGDGTHGGRALDGDGTGRRKGTPPRGTDVPQEVRRRGGLTAWARRLTGGRGTGQETAGPGGTARSRPVLRQCRPSAPTRPRPGRTRRRCC